MIYCNIVIRRLAFAAAISLCACGQSDHADLPGNTHSETAPAHLPLDNSTGFLDGYSLEVPRQGDFLWNGMPVDQVVLSDYIRQFAGLPRGAGSLFVAFEPGVAETRAQWVRRQVIESGLCAQHRCAEVGWHVPRPVVN